MNIQNSREFTDFIKENIKIQSLTAEIGWTHNITIFQKCKDNLVGILIRKEKNLLEYLRVLDVK